MCCMLNDLADEKLTSRAACPNFMPIGSRVSIRERHNGITFSLKPSLPRPIYVRVCTCGILRYWPRPIAFAVDCVHFFVFRFSFNFFSFLAVELNMRAATTKIPTIRPNTPSLACRPSKYVCMWVCLYLFRWHTLYFGRVESAPPA